MWKDAYINIAKGNVTGKTAYRSYGHNHSLAATNETVRSLSTTTEYLDKGANLEVFSTSANDDTSGTGIRTVRITGLDADWAYATEDITLAGEDTLTTVNEYIRVFGFSGVTCGSGGIAADEIYIENATNDTTLAAILVNKTRSYSAIFTVPLGKTFYLTQIYASTAAAVLTNVSLWVRHDGEAWQEKAGMQVWLSGNTITFDFPYKLEAKTDIELRAKGNTGDVVAGFQGWYE